MKQSGRTDSPTTQTALPVAVIERGAWFAYLGSRGLTPNARAIVSLRTAAAILSEVASSGRQVHVFCLTDQSANRTLVMLRQKERSSGVSLMIPESATDPRCIVLPESVAERRALLASYGQLIVVGNEALSIHLTPSEVPAGEPVVLTA